MEKVFEIQTLISFIEKLKNEGKVYNDTDFCKKVGFPKSYLSDFKAGRKEFNEIYVRKIRLVYPEFLKDDASESVGETITMSREAWQTIVSQQETIRSQQEDLSRLIAAMLGHADEQPKKAAASS